MDTLSNVPCSSSSQRTAQHTPSTDNTCSVNYHLFRQFPLNYNLTFSLKSGSSLLVTPVFVPLGEEHEYYLPAGKWTNFWNSTRIIQGPIWVKEHVPINEIPVWVREGSVLLLGPAGIGKPDYDYTQNLEVRVYGFDAAGKESVEVDVPSGKGVEVVGKVRVGKGGKVEVVEGQVGVVKQEFL
jgi:alpha-glucosidase (family GH31 glycosyl hydrolase)